MSDPIYECASSRDFVLNPDFVPNEDVEALDDYYAQSNSTGD